MAHAVSIPHNIASKNEGIRRIPAKRKRSKAHKKATKKEKMTSEIKADRFMFQFLTDFFEKFTCYL